MRIKLEYSSSGTSIYVLKYTENEEYEILTWNSYSFPLLYISMNDSPLC